MYEAEKTRLTETSLLELGVVGTITALALWLVKTAIQAALIAFFLRYFF